MCGRSGDLTAWAHAADGPLNVVLFVPLGFLLDLLLRRPVRAAPACAALSLGIEGYQAALTSPGGAFADVVANSLGAGSARWPPWWSSAWPARCVPRPAGEPVEHRPFSRGSCSS